MPSFSASVVNGSEQDGLEMLYRPGEQEAGNIPGSRCNFAVHALRRASLHRTARTAPLALGASSRTPSAVCRQVQSSNWLMPSEAQCGWRANFLLDRDQMRRLLLPDTSATCARERVCRPRAITLQQEILLMRLPGSLRSVPTYSRSLKCVGTMGTV